MKEYKEDYYLDAYYLDELLKYINDEIEKGTSEVYLNDFEREYKRLIKLIGDKI